MSSYRRDLRRYVDHLAGVGVTRPDEVAESHVTEFLMRLREGDENHPPLGSGSAARAVVAVRRNGGRSPDRQRSHSALFAGVALGHACILAPFARKSLSK